MTDTQAIRARHIREFTGTVYGDGYTCAACGQDWGENGCDAHQLGVALDEMTQKRNDVAFAKFQSIEGLNAGLQEAREQAQAAIERERRLRAALTRMLDKAATHDHPESSFCLPMSCPRWWKDALRAALATTPEGER